jgi:hypothetical protein
VVVGQPTLRSVDSEGAGRVIQPRKDRTEEADVVKTAEGNTGGAVWVWHRGFSGVSEQGMRTTEVHPGTWEARSSPFSNPGKGHRVTNAPG